MTTDDLITAATLGTARRPLPAEWVAWLEGQRAADPTADEGELLLAAIALGERAGRLRLSPTRPDSPTLGAAPPERRAAPAPEMTRGAALIAGGTYPELLPALLEWLLRHDHHLPFEQLPPTLDFLARLSAAEPTQVVHWLAATGERGPWLARLNPAWERLHPDFDFAAAWRATVGARDGAVLLRQWRARSPEAAREALTEGWAAHSPRNQTLLLEALAVNLSPDDTAFLTAALVPRRAGVRQTAARLLLRIGDPSVVADFRQLGRAALPPDGQWQRVLSGPSQQELLQRYGGLPRRGDLATHLLGLLPPELWAELQGDSLRHFYGGLSDARLVAAVGAAGEHRSVAAATALIEALSVRTKHPVPEEALTELVRVLPAEAFTAVFHGLLDRERDLFHPTGPALQLAVLTRHGWSERITRAVMTQLTQAIFGGRAGYLLRGVEARWKAAIPRLHPGSFNWLRGQLQAATERPDGLGRLATRTLQVVGFWGRVVPHAR